MTAFTGSHTSSFQSVSRAACSHCDGSWQGYAHGLPPECRSEPAGGPFATTLLRQARSVSGLRRASPPPKLICTRPGALGRWTHSYRVEAGPPLPPSTRALHTFHYPCVGITHHVNQLPGLILPHEQRRIPVIQPRGRLVHNTTIRCLPADAPAGGVVAIAQAERRLGRAACPGPRPPARRGGPQGSPRAGLAPARPGGRRGLSARPWAGTGERRECPGGAAGRRPACLRACESEAAARSGASRGGAADTRHLFP